MTQQPPPSRKLVLKEETVLALNAPQVNVGAAITLRCTPPTY